MESSLDRSPRQTHTAAKFRKSFFAATRVTAAYERARNGTFLGRRSLQRSDSLIRSIFQPGMAGRMSAFGPHANGDHRSEAVAGSNDWLPEAVTLHRLPSSPQNQRLCWRCDPLGQELYLSIDTEKDRNWVNACRGYLLMFKPMAQSSEDVPEFMWTSLDPRFATFFKSVISQEDHFFMGRREGAVLASEG